MRALNIPLPKNGSRLIAFPVLLLSLVAAGPAQASLVHDTSVAIDSTVLLAGSAVDDTDSIFAEDATDLTTNILSQVTDPAFNSFSRAAAGPLGQVGLEAGMFSRGALLSRVLIVSDEFVNPFGQAAAVTSNFIIDGGLLVDSFSRDARLIFSLQVGAEHVGVTGEETDEFDLLISGAQAADFGRAGGFFIRFFGGSYIFTIETDSVGTRSIGEEIAGGLDLGITQISGTEFEIPFSLQSLDLGTVGPGERLLLGYDLTVQILVDSVTEGTFASFSDPFVLDGDPIRTSVTFTEATTTAVPEPGTLPLLSAALLVLGLAVATATDKRVVFYCACGERAAKAVQTALQAGLRNSCHIKVGHDVWKKEYGPVEAAS